MRIAALNLFLCDCHPSFEDWVFIDYLNCEKASKLPIITSDLSVLFIRSEWWTFCVWIKSTREEKCCRDASAIWRTCRKLSQNKNLFNHKLMSQWIAIFGTSSRAKSKPVESFAFTMQSELFVPHYVDWDDRPERLPDFITRCDWFVLISFHKMLPVFSWVDIRQWMVSTCYHLLMSSVVLAWFVVFPWPCTIIVVYFMLIIFTY